MPGRLAAAAELRLWLERGGPSAEAARGREQGGPPPFMVSEKVELYGDDANISLRAARPVQAGELLVGVALDCAFHPRSGAVGAAESASVDRAAAALRSAAAWRTPLLDGAVAGRAELVALLARELLAGRASPWWPYLQTLPAARDAAPPALWAPLRGSDAARRMLGGTTIGAMLAADAIDLEALCGEEAWEIGPLRELPELLGAADAAGAREAVLRALGLLSTRSIEGVGLVPFLDLLNGSPSGAHNATFERANLAVSEESAEQAPCIAAVSAKAIGAGEEVTVSYGEHSAAEFLYRYGWAPGGPDAPAAAETPHDVVALQLLPAWEALSDLQRSVLERHKFGAAALRAAAENPSGSPLGIRASEAAEGKIPPHLRQLALVASCGDEAALKAMVQTGRPGSHGVAPADIAACVTGWAGGAVGALCAPLPPADSGEEGRLAARVCRGEREALLRWMGGLQRAFGLPRDALLRATRQHVTACRAAPAAA